MGAYDPAMEPEAVAAVAELAARGVITEAWTPQAREAAARARKLHAVGDRVRSTQTGLRHMHGTVSKVDGGYVSVDWDKQSGQGRATQSTVLHDQLEPSARSHLGLNWDRAPGGKRYEASRGGHSFKVVRQNTAAGGPAWKAYHTDPRGGVKVIHKGDSHKAAMAAVNTYAAGH